MPQFQESSYAISDPLNPPENLPQVTEAQFDKGMTIYEGTQRALKLTGAAFDTTHERFTVIGKQAKAFGAGIKAATEFEKVKGDYLDYQGQLENNEQKGISLGHSFLQALTPIPPEYKVLFQLSSWSKSALHTELRTCGLKLGQCRC